MKKFVVVLLLATVALASGPAGDAVAADQKTPYGLLGRSLALFEVDGVVFTDVDEPTGRLVVGVTNRGLARAVQAQAGALGIAAESIDIVESKAFVFASTLRDDVDPEVGGLQIAWQKSGRRSTLTYVCTLGFNATRAGTAGYVTNSHCSSSQFATDGTLHYQPSVSPGNVIGEEIADPGAFSCSKKKRCRYSDAAFSARASGVDAALGSLARTSGPGSLDITGSFNITGEAAGNAAVGTVLNKVGRTTGLTSGTVQYSNVNVGVLGTNIILLGQDIVGAASGGGDSGSPVFRINDDGTAELAGVLWGGATDGSNFVYSPMTNLELELGDLITR